jgi:hypothetical protein
MPTATPYKLCLAAGASTWTNMPAALTEFLGLLHHRQRADLTDADRCRLCVRVSTVGFNGANLKVQYSADESAWSDLTATVALAPAGTKATAWTDVPAGARGDVFLGGNGTADPVVGTITLEVR